MPGTKNFTATQLRAIQHDKGPVEVKAPPGTGKTTIILERFAWLIETSRAWKYDILCLTFTHKDAEEIRLRLQERLGEDIENLAVHTMHAYSRLILQAEHEANSEKAFRIFDPPSAYRLLQKAMKETEVDEAVWSPRFMSDEIAAAKESGVTPETFLSVPESFNQQVVAKVYARYQELLNEHGGYDFADLIGKTVFLLESRPDLLAQIHQQRRYIMVDEWQDTSLGQYRLVRLLTGPEANLFVVGDDAQSIYEWRSANYKQLAESFYADFPQAEQIVLADNFRSTQQIIDCSTALVQRKHVYVRTLSHRGDGPPVKDIRVQSDRDEAVLVTNEVKRLQNEYGLEWKDMAVLMRTNAQSVLFQQEMLLQGVPYTLLQGQRLYARREVRDILAYLSIAHDGDEAYLTQVINSPPRGLGPNTQRALKGASLSLTWDHIFAAMTDGEASGIKPKAIESLKAFYDLLMDLTARAATDAPAELIDYIFEASGYRKWLQTDLEDQSKTSYIDVLKQEAAEFETIGEFLEAIRRKLGENEVFEGENGVVLSTIHTVKGLEFSAVFVVGMEEGLLPHKKAAKGSHEEGERRLTFVAFTRAIDYLYLISARRRSWQGRPVEHRPSRYLFDLPNSVVEVKRL